MHADLSIAQSTLPAVVAFLVTLLALPVAIGLAPWPGLVDPVDRDRDGHPIARSGGLAIAIGWATGVLLLVGTEALPLVLAGLAVLAIGLHDDLTRSSPRLRLTVLAVICFGAALAGVRVEAAHLPGLGPVHLGVLGLPLSAAWILGTTVIFDFIDGLDGLAGSLAGLAGLGLLLGGVGIGGVAAGALVGATGAFLLLNRPPAQLYMGDNGSNLVGFLVGAITLMALDRGGGFEVLPALLMISVPLLDGVTTILRRLSRGDLFGADLEHIHHRLVDAGRPAGRALAVMSAAAAVCSVVGVAMCRWRPAIVLVPLAVAGLALLWRAARVSRPGEPSSP